MSNANITEAKVDIETIITNTLGSFDNDATYELQNVGLTSINYDTIIGDSTETTQRNVQIPFSVARYKHKENTTVKAYSIASELAILKME